MYARIVIAQPQADRNEQFINALHSVVLADLQNEPGFQGMYVCQQPENNHLIAFSLFDTKEAAQASGIGFAQRRLPQMIPLLAEKPRTDVYEVVLQPS